MNFSGRDELGPERSRAPEKFALEESVDGDVTDAEQLGSLAHGVSQPGNRRGILICRKFFAAQFIGRARVVCHDAPTFAEFRMRVLPTEIVFSRQPRLDTAPHPFGHESSWIAQQKAAGLGTA